MSIKVSLRACSNFPLDWSNFSFDQWWEKSAAEIKQLISSDHAYVESFKSIDVQVNSDEQKLINIYPGECLFHGLGTGLKTGCIIIHGNVGHRLGEKLAGGSIEVLGNTLDYTAQGMKKGTIIIRGDCGDYLAAPMQGDKAGMRGGEIHIQGNSGSFAAHRMRRGLITIKNSAGPGLASEMLAGTIIVGNANFSQLGTGIRRGTIVSLKHGDKFNLSGFSLACKYQPVWWRIFAKHLLEQKIYTSEDQLFDCVFARYTGDSLELNKAEILLRA